ncbi:hypothetical protein [Methanolapillus ohkumae]|uniref:Uncharacterized protein n=1 Tax=Methanolapillus ohkumae TaxID=3028298 RepID=A0AA96V7D3_9EURY|nr:hypothetical protein MsAm2_13080 [Methanosarcinaceae archaeon Am2]
MTIDWNDNFSEYELHIIYKICLRGRICNRHIEGENLCQGVRSDKIGSVKKALKELERKEIIHSYKTQNRYDYCIPNENYRSAINLLKRYAPTYEWIKNI